MRVLAWFATGAAVASVPPFFRYEAMPVVRRVFPDLRRAARRLGAPLDHDIGVRSEGITRELAGGAALSLEQKRLGIIREAYAVDILWQKGFEVMMALHRV